MTMTCDMQACPVPPPIRHGFAEHLQPAIPQMEEAIDLVTSEDEDQGALPFLKTHTQPQDGHKQCAIPTILTKITKLKQDQAEQTAMSPNSLITT